MAYDGGRTKEVDVELSRISRARILPGFGSSTAGLVDVEIRDGEIAAVTPASDVPRGLDADGALLLPGLWDGHTHFSTHALIGQCVDLSGAETLEQIVAALEARPTRDLQLGFGFRAGTWATAPSAALLDTYFTHPVALIAADMHAVWCNTAGLTAVAAPAHSRGYLVEDLAFDAIRHLMSTYTSHVDAAVHQAVAAATTRGVVGIVDMEMDWAIGSWQRRSEDSVLDLQVEAACYPSTLERVLAEGWSTGTVLAPGLKVGPLKLISDGSMNTKTAQCLEGYDNPLPHLPHGKANFSESELLSLLHRARTGGLQVSVHAIGDLACRRALDAFEASGAQGSIEHAQLIADADVPRFARLGITASVQPSHLIDDAPMIPEIWPHAGPRAFPLRTLLDAGARLRFGSDAPVAPLDPWVSMDAAVHRSYEPSQAITPREALAASVRTRIAPGEPADLILVDASPQQLAEGRFRTVQVLGTLCRGRSTYTAGVLPLA